MPYNVTDDIDMENSLETKKVLSFPPPVVLTCVFGCPLLFPISLVWVSGSSILGDTHGCHLLGYWAGGVGTGDTFTQTNNEVNNWNHNPIYYGTSKKQWWTKASWATAYCQCNGFHLAVCVFVCRDKLILCQHTWMSFPRAEWPLPCWVPTLCSPLTHQLLPGTPLAMKLPSLWINHTFI